MDQGMKNILRIGVDCPGDFFRGFPVSATELFPGGRLQLEEPGGRFLSSFDPRLMVGVDVYQRPIKSNRSLIECDQCANAERVCFRDANGNRLPVLFEKGGPCSAEKSMKIIAAGHARLDIEPRFAPVF